MQITSGWLRQHGECDDLIDLFDIVSIERDELLRRIFDLTDKEFQSWVDLDPKSRTYGSDRERQLAKRMMIDYWWRCIVARTIVAQPIPDIWPNDNRSITIRASVIDGSMQWPKGVEYVSIVGCDVRSDVRWPTLKGLSLSYSRIETGTLADCLIYTDGTNWLVVREAYG